MKDIEKFAQKMGASVAGKVPNCGGGAFGAARLAAAVSSMKGGNMVDKYNFFEVCVVLKARVNPNEGAERSVGRRFSAHGLRTDQLGMGRSPAEALLELGIALTGLLYSSEADHDMCFWRSAPKRITDAALSADAVRMPDSVMDGVGWLVRAESPAGWVRGDVPCKGCGSTDDDCDCQVAVDQGHLDRLAALMSVTEDLDGDGPFGDGPFVCTVDWGWIREHGSWRRRI